MFIMSRRNHFLLLRAQKANARGKLTTPEELVDMVRRSNMRCALSNAPVFLSFNGRGHYWSLSIDHKIPLSEARYSTEPIASIENLQVTCHIMNNIKKSRSNDYLMNWWKEFTQQQLRE